MSDKTVHDILQYRHIYKFLILAATANNLHMHVSDSNPSWALRLYHYPVNP